MNERIRELMDQAGELSWEEHKAKCLKNGLDPLMPFGNNLMAIFEKFAELIIRECLDIVDDEGCGEGGSIRSMEKIKQHFEI